MKKEIHLTVIITQKDLAAYYEHKNIDSATLLLKLYTAFLDVFFRKKTDTLPKYEPYDHIIYLKEGTQASVFTLYSMSCDEALKLCHYLDENLSKEFIWVSHSDVATSVLFMKKPEGGLHFCVDYWGLNVITVKNWYLLPLISETLNCLSWVRIFIKLNIIAAFNRLCIWEDDEALTAFCTHFSLFEYLIMPFDLCNSSASFQNYINDTLQKYLNIFCTAYLDDILIYSEIEAEYEIHVKCVLQKLHEADLQAYIIKCVFHIKEISYLELIIITEEIKMNLIKVSIIVEWLTLMNIKDIQSFLSFTNFYQRFIYGYSKLASLLTYLTKKDVLFEWITECQSAFNALKKAFTSDVILHYYNLNLKIVVETDTSDYVSEGILFQYNKNDVLYLIAYFFKKHNSAKCNYEIYDKELMVIIHTFKEWRSELKDSIYLIDVIVMPKGDHLLSQRYSELHLNTLSKPLRWLSKKCRRQDLNSQPQQPLPGLIPSLMLQTARFYARLYYHAQTQAHNLLCQKVITY